MGKINKGYRDPTADIAIGNIMRETRRIKGALKRRDGTPVAENIGGKAVRTWNTVLEEFKEIDKEKRD